jgi:hypothetical protein
LLGFAAGTIYHGGLASKDIWQILQAILPEFSKALGEATQEQTCASPWAGSCPPKSVTRGSFTIPPDFLISTAVDFCAEEVNEALQGAYVQPILEMVNRPLLLRDTMVIHP